MAVPYNYNPNPRSGRGAYGMVPGVVTVPPNLYQGVQSIYPGLSDQTTQAGRVIGGQLRGELSPETINTIQDEAARFGVASGMPLSQFAGYRGLRNLGRSVEDTQAKGLEAYNRMLATLGPMVTDPALAAQLATWNATMGAAPDPAAAAAEMQRRYLQGLQTGMGARTPAGGFGGFGNPAGGTIPRSTGGGGGGGGTRTTSQNWWDDPNTAMDWLFLGGDGIDTSGGDLFGPYSPDWGGYQGISDPWAGFSLTGDTWGGGGGGGSDWFGPYSTDWGGYQGLGGGGGGGGYDWWSNPDDTTDWLFYGGDGGGGGYDYMGGSDLGSWAGDIWGNY